VRALLLLGAITILLLTSCGPTKRYRPIVKYAHPSSGTLQKILRTTYGDPYRYAGQGPNRFDCSGLIYYSFATMNLWLPRTARDQSRRGTTISINELHYGDLIFFDTHRPYRGRVNHVGIYIGGGRFLHASSTKRRVVSASIHSSFYHKRIIVCKRLILDRKSINRNTQSPQLASMEPLIQKETQATTITQPLPRVFDSNQSISNSANQALF